MGNLEGLPVSTRVSNGRSSAYSLRKLGMLQNPTALSLIDHQNDDDNALSKSDVTLQFNLEVRLRYQLIKFILLNVIYILINRL